MEAEPTARMGSDVTPVAGGRTNHTDATCTATTGTTGTAMLCMDEKQLKRNHSKDTVRNDQPVLPYDTDDGRWDKLNSEVETIYPASGGLKTEIKDETLDKAEPHEHMTASRDKSPEPNNNSNPTPATTVQDIALYDQGNSFVDVGARSKTMEISSKPKNFLQTFVGLSNYSMNTTQDGRCSCNEHNMIQKLEKEIENLRGELAKCTSGYQHCQRKLRLAGQESANLQRECERLEKECHDAIHDKQQLLCTIQGAVVERTSGGISTNGFPTGDTIASKCEEYGDESVLLLKDLARTLSTTGDAWAVTYAGVDLRYCYACAKQVADQVVAEKQTQFEMFVGNPINEPTNILIDLMWLSIMQKYVQKMIDDGMNGMFSFQIQGHCAAYLSKDLYDNGEHNSTTVLGFCKSILYLDLVCRYSKPRCFLFPDIGTTVRFDSKYHKQIYLGLKGETKVKQGDFVKVYFPGLYFVSPDVGAERPKVCALVAHQSNYIDC